MLVWHFWRTPRDSRRCRPNHFPFTCSTSRIGHCCLCGAAPSRGRNTTISGGQTSTLNLMSEDNLDKWESGFNAKECRVLMTHLLPASTEAVRCRDDLHKGCFTRTGCLLTVLPNEVERMQKSSHRGLKLPYKMLPALPAPLANPQIDSATAVNLPERSMRLPARSIDGVVDDSNNEAVASREATASTHAHMLWLRF